MMDSLLPEMPLTASSLFSAYASTAAYIMLLRTMVADLVPEPLRSYTLSAFKNLFSTFFGTRSSSTVTLTVDELVGYGRNEVYDAAMALLRPKIASSSLRFGVTKTPRQKRINFSMDDGGQEIDDVFEGVRVKWRFVCSKSEGQSEEKRRFELDFDEKFRSKVLESYLPHIQSRWKATLEEEKIVRLYTRSCYDHGGGRDDEDSCHGSWRSICLEHPVAFDKVAMDPDLKKMVMDDLKRFVERKEFYKRVGKAWKRGYLLYGPPGTGKSSLIAAMANYLKFDVYDLELSSIYSNSDLRGVLMSTTNRSILLIEDIDCSTLTREREFAEDTRNGTAHPKFTLSGLLNSIDGLWSSCGDERIIVFTTNHKDALDPALLRPGRMDVHIHMTYCTVHGFQLLASNYLDVQDHKLFSEIESLIENAEATPAEVAEELMSSDDADVALGRLVRFLKQKILLKDSKIKEEGSLGPREKRGRETVDATE